MQTPTLYFIVRCIVTVLVVIVGGFQLVTSAEATVPAQLLLEPGVVRRVAITGSIPEGGTVSITIRYNPSVVQVVGAYGAESYALRCASPDLSTPVIASARSATITVSCPFSVGISNDTLLTLDVQGVMGVDSVGTFGVDSIFINGAAVAGLQANVCEVVRSGGTLGRYTITQGITGTYPNPFRDRTRVVFVMRTPGNVRCALRTYQGRIVTEMPSIEATAGENAAELSIISWEVAAGAYVVTLTTDEGTYYHPVTVMK